VRDAIIGMLPKNKLGRALGKNLLVYADDKHAHAAQKPEVFTFPKTRT
jgi:large subunit ribosomal protein L13